MCAEKIGNEDKNAFGRQKSKKKTLFEKLIAASYEYLKPPPVNFDNGTP